MQVAVDLPQLLYSLNKGLKVPKKSLPKALYNFYDGVLLVLVCNSKIRFGGLDYLFMISGHLL